MAESILTWYLAEAVAHPLLRREQEIALAEAVAEGREAQAALRTNGHCGQEREQLLETVACGQEARERLARHNLRLVVSIAKGYRATNVSFSDLIQEGNAGLMKAVDKYDLSRGCRFSTYATWWIRQAISHYCKHHSRTIRVPAGKQEKIRRVVKTTKALEKKLGQYPTAEEVAESLIDMSAESVKEIRRIQHRVATFSLDRPTHCFEGAVMLGELIASNVALEDIADQRLAKERVADMLGDLKPRQASILRMRFGLGGNPPHTLQEIGDKYGLSRERIRQIEALALEQLRALHSDDLEGFFGLEMRGRSRDDGSSNGR